MKFIVFSDLHLHNWSGEIDKDTRLSKRLLVQKSILQQIIDLAIEHDAKILFGGDLLHAVGSVPVEVLNVIDWFFKEIKKHELDFYAVLGNHDLSIRKNCSEWHSALSPFQNRELRNKRLAALTPKIRFVDYDQIEDAENIKGYDIVIIHAQPDLVNKHKFHMEGVNWHKLSRANRLVMFGHHHTTRKLSPLCYVIGSPMQLTMNDTGEERGCWIVDSEMWTVTFQKLDYPEITRPETIEAKKEEKFEERIKATSFQDILLEWLDREQKPNSYLDLIQKDITERLQTTKTFFDGKIQSIYLKDFLSVDEITVKIQNGFWLVMGENGSGKTSITGEGIYWILFDETTKDVAKSEVVRNRPKKQKEAIGELQLVDSKQFYTIRRSSKDGLQIISDKKNLVEGMTKTQAQEFLEKNILGFDKHTYLASCYFSQEQLLTLAQLGDADVTNLVTNLLGFETYDVLHELMNQNIKDVTLQLQELEQSSVNLNNDIWKNGEQQKNVKEQIEMFTKQQCSLKDEQSKINQQLSEFNDLLVKIVVPSITTEEIDNSLLVLNSSKTEMSTKLWTLQESGQLKINELRKSLNLDNTKLQTILQEQARIDKEQSKIETEKRLTLENISKHEAIIKSLEENKCSYCGSILNKEAMEEHLGKEMAEIALLKASIQGFERVNSDTNKALEIFYDQEAEIRGKIESITLEIDKLDAENKVANLRNQEEITKIESEIKDVQKKKDQTLKEQIEANSRKANLTQQIKQLEERKVSLSKQLEQININDKITQLKELEEKLSVLNNQTIVLKDKNHIVEANKTIYEFWANSFSNKGIRPLLLDKFVNQFNSIVKQYCYKVSNGEFIVQFSPTSKTQAGLERNKLGLQVIYKDKAVNYVSLSGGEKTRCNLPLCLGLNKWISEKYGLTNGIFGIIVMDELFAHLDTRGRDNVADLLNEEGKNKSIFVIDHSDVLTSYTDKIWMVSKEDECTKLEVV